MQTDMVFWSPGVTLASIEKQVILKAIEHYRGNKTLTANALGISIRTLYDKLDQFAKEEKDEKEKQDDARRQREEWLQRSRGNIPNNLAGDKSTAPTTRAQNDQSVTGVRMESASHAPAKQPMPVSKRSKV